MGKREKVSEKTHDDEAQRWELCLLCYGDGYYEDEYGREHQCPDCHGYGQVYAQK